MLEIRTTEADASAKIIVIGVGGAGNNAVNRMIDENIGGVFRLTGWSPLVPSRFLVSRCTLDTAMSALLSLTGLSPSLVCFPKTVLLDLLNQLCGPNPGMHALRFGLFPFRSPLLWKSIFSFSSSGYLDVSVHRVPFHTLWIGVWIHEVFSCGFPHSDIHGSKDICSSP